jgi:hypothetical protein
MSEEEKIYKRPLSGFNIFLCVCHIILAPTLALKQHSYLCYTDCSKCFIDPKFIFSCILYVFYKFM